MDSASAERHIFGEGTKRVENLVTKKGARASHVVMVLDRSYCGKTSPESIKGNPSEGGEEMLMSAPAELLEGLLDGLNAQREMTELLDELFYDGLS